MGGPNTVKLESERNELRARVAELEAEVEHYRTKAEAYGGMVEGCGPVLLAAGYPIDGTPPGGAVEGVKRSCEALVAERDALKAEVARLREALLSAESRVELLYSDLEDSIEKQFGSIREFFAKARKDER